MDRHIQETTNQQTPPWRRRGLYLGLAVVTTALGLLSRSNLIPLPEIIEEFSGDALWAMLIFWCCRILAPFVSIQTSTAIPTLICFAVECSQLYQAPWINAIRNTTLGGLILGFGFKWSDLLMYLLGLAVATVIDQILLQHRAFRRETPKAIRNDHHADHLRGQK